MPVSPTQGAKISRRDLLAKSGMTAATAALGMHWMTSLASGEYVPNDSERAIGAMRRALEKTLHQHPLPLSQKEASTIVAIEITEPRLSITVSAKPGKTSLISAAEETNAGVVLSYSTAHNLIIGRFTVAYALASDQLKLLGDRSKLGALHHLPSLAHAAYTEEMTAIGEARSLKYSQEEVV